MTDPTFDQRLRSSRLSRRRFLQVAGFGSAGLAGAVLIGCGSSNGGTTTPTATAMATETGTATATGTAAATGTATATGTAMPALGTANVLGIWGSTELDNFRAMVKPWEDQTGGTMDFTGTRDLTAILTTRVQGDNPPDIAIPAELGLFNQFVGEQKVKSLADLGIAEDVMANYPKGFTDLATVDGSLYGFFMKASSKATIWYSPAVFQSKGWEPLTVDSTWDDLVALSNQIKDEGTMPPWSIGVENGGASGWPGTDWIQQIILNTDGGDVYDGIIDGSIPFTDDRMKQAWQQFGSIALGDGMTAQGGATGINATNFQDSVYLPFDSTPQAAMVYMGSFASGFISKQFPNAQAGVDYDFMPWPGGGVTGGANIVYAFDTEPTTQSLMAYLASAQAQEVWVQAGGFTSVNEQVSLDAYQDTISKNLAQQLTQASLFRFDLDDAIGGALQQAYFTGITQYLANPDQLDSILSSIEQARGS